MPSDNWTYIRQSIYEDTIGKMVNDVICEIKCRYNTNVDLNINYNKDRMNILKSYSSIEKENSLIELYPNLVKEWNYEKNVNINPKMFSKGSSRKVWWKCLTCGFEWETKISSRTSLKTGCPKCGRVKAGKNESSNNKERYLINNPIFNEYNSEKNIDVEIDKLRIGSKKVIWWKCSKCGFEWQAQVYTRLHGFGKCPNCFGKRKS